MLSMPLWPSRAPSSCMENRPAARRGSVQGSPKLKAVLSVFWAIFHAGNSHFRANRGGAALCEQSGVRGAARGSARAQRETWELAGCPSVLQDASKPVKRIMGSKVWGGYQGTFGP